MAVVRWSPISDLLAVHSAMDRLFNGSFTRPGGGGRADAVDAESEGYLPLDVYRTDTEWVVRAAVPGADPNSVEVICEGNTVRISGEIQWPEDIKSENVWLRENFYGQFRRQVTLPEDAICDDSRAEFQNGMLILHVPRDVTRTQPKRIPISSGSTAASGGSGAGDRELAASTGSRK
jgi:HSP20 family protein